jgi:hypothetical protein
MIIILSVITIKLIKCSSLVSSQFSKRNQQLYDALLFTLAAENEADEWLIKLFFMPYEYTEVKIKLHNFIHSCIGDVFYNRCEIAKSKLGL